MKKILITFLVIALSLSYTACSSKKSSAASVAKEWCEMNGKVHKAANETDKEAAKAALDKWENDMEAKYKGDEAFMKEVEKEVEKCEAASEGR